MRTSREMDMRDMMQKTIDTLAAENEALRRPPTERPYVCPCPDGCNGCEVPDFALKEIERLTAQVASPACKQRPPPGRKSRAGLLKEIERLTTEASCAAHNAAEYHDIIRGQRKRIEKLEAALREITSDELYNEAQMAIIADEALAKSEGEK